MIKLGKDFDIEYLNTLTHKTPFFVFSKKKIKKNYQLFKQLFPRSTIFYAMKANSEPEILRLLAGEGCGFEVASVYELNLLKKIKVYPEKIVYGTSVKPIDHIKDIFEYGVDKFAVDSFPELEKIAAAASGAGIYIRTIANDSGSVFKFSEKFGVEAESIIPLFLRAKELGLRPFGISFHVGSQASDPEAWANALQKIEPVIKDLKKLGFAVEVINLGGGYPCKYASSETVPSLEEIATHTFKQYRKFSSKPQLFLEPGRGMIADTGVLVTSVIARIERRGSTWLFLDAGVYNALFEAMAYQGSTRYPITSLRPVKGSGEVMFSLAGPTGDSPDVITKEALLPTDIEVGDKLVIHNVGAYSLSVTSTFNGFPKPDVYYI